MKHSGKPSLLILIGQPGSGKTYLAEKLFKGKGFVHINSDGVRAKYFTNPQFTAEERARVYDKIREVTTTELLAGHNVIFDGNLLTNAARHEALEYYQGIAGSTVLFIFLDVPRQVALQRALTRTSSTNSLYNAMPEDRALRMHDTFEPLDADLPQIAVHDLDDVVALELTIKQRLQL